MGTQFTKKHDFLEKKLTILHKYNVCVFVCLTVIVCGEGAYFCRKSSVASFYVVVCYFTLV